MGPIDLIHMEDAYGTFLDPAEAVPLRNSQVGGCRLYSPGDYYFTVEEGDSVLLSQEEFNRCIQ
jgi:hypothetical protein